MDLYVWIKLYLCAGIFNHEAVACLLPVMCFIRKGSAVSYNIESETIITNTKR